MNTFKAFITAILLLGCFAFSCKEAAKSSDFVNLLSDEPQISGKQQYLNSPFLTPGEQLYMVGHQNGSFPEIGWHIPGEMGGIWMHPIKLMDGFKVKVRNSSGTEITLDQAAMFTNFPMANKQEFKLETLDLKIDRWQFVPIQKSGMVVQFDLYNTGGTNQKISLDFTGYADLRPTWLGERTQMHDSIDIATYSNGRVSVKDSGNPWHLVFGADSAPVNEAAVSTEYKGLGIGHQMEYELEVPAGQVKSLRFIISGSMVSLEDATATFDDLLENGTDYLLEKRGHYRELANKSKLTLEDKELEQAFEWLKYNCDWLVQTVPGIGTGITAGIPDYPWWFGVDSEYALQGYMAIGQDEIVHQTIALLDSVSNAVNGNGRIIHEMSSNGAVFNPGNINETPQFATLIWEIYKWNGDKEFLKAYFPTVQQGLHWLMEENDANKNGFPDGFGMMEIHGLDSEMIDVAAYTQKAFADASAMAKELRKDSLAAYYSREAIRLKELINTNFWSEEFNSYADFRGTDAQALHLIEDAIVRADTLGKPWAVAELIETQTKIRENQTEGSRPFVLHHNWVVNTPMETGLAEPEKALQGLNTAANFTNPFGLFVTGIDRDETAGTDSGSFEGSKVFSYTGAVMTLPTSVLAISENNYGRPEKALDYIKRMTRSFSYALPGSMYEVSPDYGMITQAWNIYGFAVPIVGQFFGIQPMASENTIHLKPQMPKSWKNVSLEQVAVAENEISMSYLREENQISWRIAQLSDTWTIKFHLPEDCLLESVSDPDHEIIINEDGSKILSLKTKEFELKLRHSQ